MMRLDSQHPLIKPNDLINQLPLDSKIQQFIANSRKAANDIISGKDSRLLVIMGPCSIHDTQSALEYAEKLKTAAEAFSDDLFIIMRTYFEKPRTTIGWKGLISDPFLDGRFDINEGLFIARNLLLNINQLGLPTGTEFLDTLILPHYLIDLVSWCAVGARTVESQIHRELASGLPFTVGFKNNTDGNIKVAVDAVKVASYPHHFLSINQEGNPSIIYTRGNPYGHIILRGAHNGPNYSSECIKNATNLLLNANLAPLLMIDCSHGNSMKDHLRQSQVLKEIIQNFSHKDHSVCGIMLESNLIAGKQDINLKQYLVHGQSITDACIGWDESYMLLEQLAKAVSRASAVKGKMEMLTM